MSETAKGHRPLPKLAVLTTEEAGLPDLKELRESYEITCSKDTGMNAVLYGADSAFLWDAALAGELERALSNGSGKDLKWVHAAVTGVDALSLSALKANGIILTNAAGVYDDAIAEYALAAVLSFERKLSHLRDQQRKHEWSWLHGGMLKGKNILVVGPGRIGKACARLFRMIGCDVAAIGSRHKAPTELFSSIEPSSDIIARVHWADHIIVTAPLTPSTRHLLNAQTFEACKPTAHIVNVGRGPIIDTDALVHALLNGQIAGATLDVLENEPLESDSVLWDMPNVLITPHIAGDVGDFEDALIRQFIDNAKRWLKRKPLCGVVDLTRGY